LKAWIAALFLVFGPASVNAGEPAADQLRCDIGPAAKVFGGTKWLVYGCGRDALAIVSAPDNPANPTSFLLMPLHDVYRLAAVGNGKKEARRDG